MGMIHGLKSTLPLYRPTHARTKKLSGSLPKGEIVLRHVFSSHFVTPRDTSYDFLLCLLFCSSPFPRPSAFPHHIPFVFVCLPCLPIPLFVMIPMILVPRPIFTLSLFTLLFSRRTLFLSQTHVPYLYLMFLISDSSSFLIVLLSLLFYFDLFSLSI